MDKESAEQCPVLEISNFGPINRARIELRPLTVLVGPSNTGKSYLAVLIYALHRAFAGMAESREFEQRASGSERKMGESQSKFVDRLISEIEFPSESKSIDFEGDALTSSLLDIVNQSDGMIQEVVRCLGLHSQNELKRKYSSGDSEVRLVLPNDGTNALPTELFSEAKRGCRVAVFGPSRISMEPLALWNSYQRWKDVDDANIRDSAARSDFGKNISRTAFEQLMESMLAPAYYLPVNRAGIMNYHTLVFRGLLGNARFMGPEPRAGEPKLSGVLSDFLRELLGMDECDPEQRDFDIFDDSEKEFEEVAAEVESSILNGSIVTEETSLVNHPVFYFRPKGWRVSIPLMNASSMVSELAPLILYLRGLVDVGDTIIVEQPESHLHASAQIQLTNTLAALVQEGVKVIVTTHSDWVVSCLSNAVLRDREQVDTTKSVQSGKFDGFKKAALRESDVGVWVFDKQNEKSGSTVSQLEFVEPGRYSPDYEDYLMDLHNEWAGMTSTGS